MKKSVRKLVSSIQYGVLSILGFGLGVVLFPLVVLKWCRLFSTHPRKAVHQLYSPVTTKKALSWALVIAMTVNQLGLYIPYLPHYDIPWFHTKSVKSITLDKKVLAPGDTVHATILSSRPQDVKPIVVDVRNKKVNIPIEQSINGNQVTLTIEPPREFKPGKYTLEVPDGKDMVKQDFAWGVLAINPDKSVYAPGDKAFLSLAVLDETGLMVCNADVKLKIKNEKLKIEEELSTENGKIKINPECKVKNFVTKPDYEAAYIVGEEGTYTMELTAVTKNGSYSIKDFFVVKSQVPFTIQRSAATRIYPVYKYPVNITVIAHEDFAGEIQEFVPSSFQISNQEGSDVFFKSIKFGKLPDLPYSGQQIIWDVNLKKGETIKLGYIYESPHESPNFFLNGPLHFYSKNNTLVYKETRAWQIAVDVLNTYVEQQINISDQTYSTSSHTAVPTDNSLGLAKFDGNEYNNETAYFDAVGKVSSDINTTDNVGRYSSMYCVSATDCKIVYTDATDSSLRFKDCDDATCSTGTVSVLDGASGCALSGGDGCNTAISIGSYPSLDCSGGTSDCKVSYIDSTNTALRFADCDAATCSSGSVQILDGDTDGTGCSLTTGDVCDTSSTIDSGTSLDCSQGVTDCKISYKETPILSGTNMLVFADCDDATCSTGSISELDGITGCNLTGGDVCGTATVGLYSSLDCSAGASDCKISYQDFANTALLFADCDDAQCSTGSVQVLDGDTDGSNCSLTGGDICNTADDTGYYSSIDCTGGSADCKIIYNDNSGGTTNGKVVFADCDDATCSTGSISELDGASGCNLTSGDVCSSGTLASYTSLDCTGGVSDCKVAFYNFISSGVEFGDCANATCSTGTEIDADGLTGCKLTSGDACNPTTDVGQYVSLDCSPGVNDCKMAYYDVTNQALGFGDCDSDTCNSGSYTQVDGGSNNIGPDSAVYCVSSTDCKVAYYNATDTSLRFKDCDDASCSTGSISVVDGDVGCSLTSGDGCETTTDVGQYVSIDCTGGTSDCKMTYYDLTNSALEFADCDDAQCSSGSVSDLDGRSGCNLTSSDNCINSAATGQYTSLDCSQGVADCKITYFDQTNSALEFGDCDDAQCLTGSTSDLDGVAGCNLTLNDACNTGMNGGKYSSLDCSNGAADCKVAYYDETNTALEFADCDDSQCLTGSVSDVDGVTGCNLMSGDVCDGTASLGNYSSLDCAPGTSDCKISYYNQSITGVMFADCDDAQCMTGGVEEAAGNTGCTVTNCNSTGDLGQYTSLDCTGGATDCKLIFQVNATSDLGFIDCGNATCSSGILSNPETSNSVGSYGSLDCSPGVSDCKVTFYDATNQTVRFLDCGSATCGSVTSNAIDSGAELAWIKLYDSSGTYVPDSLITMSSATSGYTRYRSHALTLTDNTQYTARIMSNDDTLTAYLKAARISLDQSTGSGITDTQTHVEVGDATTTTNTSYDVLANKKIYLWDTDKFSGTKSVYFEATLKGSGAGVTASAALSSSSNCSSTVSGSEVTVTGSSWTLSRSSAISLTDDTEYWVCFKTSSGTGSIANAKIVIDQTDASGVSLEVVHDYLNTVGTDADTTYTSQDYLNELNRSSFSSTAAYYFEAVMNTSAGTGYAQLYNASDASAITGSEITTTNAGYTRVRSSQITSGNLPSAAKNLDVQVKNSATNTTSVADARLIIQITSVLTPTKIVFTNGSRTITKGQCLSSHVFSIQLQSDSNAATAPTTSTVVRVTSNSSSYTIYSDSGCTQTVTSGDFTFTTSDTEKAFYLVDNNLSSPTWTLTAARQSGDTLTSDTNNYTVIDLRPNTNIKGGSTIKGGTMIQ
jgi:hypothetical protein